VREERSSYSNRRLQHGDAMPGSMPKLPDLAVLVMHRTGDSMSRTQAGNPRYATGSGDGRIAPSEVDYINAHATGTPLGTSVKRKSCTVPWEPIAPDSRQFDKEYDGPPVERAAAVEAIACLTAIHRGIIPPTVNLDDPDPECELHHVANQSEEHNVRVAISNSFGFGGNNTSLVLRAVFSSRA